MALKSVPGGSLREEAGGGGLKKRSQRRGFKGGLKGDFRKERRPWVGKKGVVQAG